MATYFGEWPEWAEQAACHGYLQTFFGETQKEEEQTADAAIMQRAQAICRTCPVRRECLTWAFDSEHSIRWGVYGGTIPQQRIEVRHEEDPVTALLGMATISLRPQEEETQWQAS